MGNRFSWNKGKKAIIDALNDPRGIASRKKSTSEVSKHTEMTGKRDGYVSYQQKELTFQESFPENLKSNVLCEKQDKLICSRSTSDAYDRKWKLNSKSDAELFMQSKLLNKMKCNDSKAQRKTSGNGAKRNQSLKKEILFRSANLSESRQQFRNNNNIGNFDCRGAHPVSSQGREIIQACFSKRHSEIGYRICMRVFEKRPDYQRFVHALGRAKWLNSSAELRDYLDIVVSKVSRAKQVHDVAAVEEISRNYGERHVSLKKYGFKPDFWVSIADALAIECVILDMANHQPTETIMAWSQLTSLMFTSIRDGYYEALRFQRRSLRGCKSSQWHLSGSIESSNGSAASVVEKIVS
uniref:GLOBIN domain-containing protein n=1 Tax=Elaeophora elaphi TaxID=1147741 RepID=A0A0R3RZQ9_9BILA